MLQCTNCQPAHLKNSRQKWVWDLWKEQLTGPRCSACGRRGEVHACRVHHGAAQRVMAERAIAAVQPDLSAPVLVDELPVPDEIERAALNISRRRATASRAHGSPLRLAFDLDGVLADMESELGRQATFLFGDSTTRRLQQQAAHGAAKNPGAEGVALSPPGIAHLKMTSRQRRRLWRHIASIDGFWETLREIEPGAIQRLAAMAADRRWEIIFLTRRPPTRGAAAQVQTQRWLESHGFSLPTVYVVQGSRGRVADALGIDLVIDDRPENCLDVVADSKARAMLIWRGDEKRLPVSAKRLGVHVLKSVSECLDILSQTDCSFCEPHGMTRRLKPFVPSEELAIA
jgi:hypothetical protein